MTYTHKNGMIYDPEDGQTIATMSESATPEQAALLARAPAMQAVLELIAAGNTEYEEAILRAFKALQ